MLDLEMITPRDYEAEENAAWLAQATEAMNRRNQDRRADESAMTQEGNHDPEVARKRLMELIKKTNKAIAPVPDDVVYEVVNPYEPT